MEYECQLVSANRLNKGIINMQKPLCTRCKNKSCTNPIIYQKMSIMGVVHTSRLYSLGDRFFFVTKCDGFVSEEGGEDEI